MDSAETLLELTETLLDSTETPLDSVATLWDWEVLRVAETGGK